MTTLKEALAKTHDRDNERTTCMYCGRLEADDEDCRIFEEAESYGGERPDLCWHEISDDSVCGSFRELWTIMEDLKVCQRVGRGEMKSVVERFIKDLYK